MARKTIGVLGGLGPKTTAHFYLELVRLGIRRDTRPPVCIFSLPLNLRKEREYFSQGRHTAYYLRQLLKGAETLIRAGSSKLVIPCNTVHEFHTHLAAAVQIPVANLIEIVAQEVVRRGWKTVFLMATSRTIQTRLYQEALGKARVKVVIPQPHDQLKLDSLIQNLLGEQTSVDHQDFLERMVVKSSTTKILLGCTDLQLLFPSSEDVIDSMHALAVHTASSAI